jgi:hypothetical protein
MRTKPLISVYAQEHRVAGARRKFFRIPQIREMTAGKIMTYKAVRGGKEVSLLIDSFGKVKEFP